MSGLYLILHKVRGEPAFDIADMVQCPHCKAGERCYICEGKGFWWQIPTSGHRAFPVCWEELHKLSYEIIANMTAIGLPDDWPDHYNAKRDDGSYLVQQAREILMRKGLINAAKPAATLYRRA